MRSASCTVRERWAIIIRGTADREFLPGCLHQGFAFAIQIRGGFVENDQQRILERSTCQGNPLDLPPDKPCPASPTTVS